MESYLVDKEILEQFADHLISEKYPDQSASSHANTKEEIMKSLDHQILKNIIGSLTREQGAKLNVLLEKSESPAVFKTFFDKNNIDLEKNIENTMVEFRNNFLKGDDNA